MTALLNGRLAGRTSNHTLGAPVPASTETGSPAGIHALIVDDDLTQAQVLGDLLSGEAAIRCTIVTSAEEALAAIKAAPPDVAILDLVMPHMDGLELLHRLRERLPALPTILVTGWPYDDQRVAAFLEVTATAYLTKPIDFEHLCDQIAYLAGPVRRESPEGV